MAEATTLKILTLGDASVGKTCIILRYAEDDFPKSTMPTIGIEYKTKQITIQNQQLRLQIWDTAGQERYHKILASTFYRRANGIVLVYDLKNQESFNHVENWMKQIRQKADPGIEIVLVGNKLDLVEDKDFTQGKELAGSFGIPFFPVSAKSGAGVGEMFKTLTDMIVANNPKLLNPNPSTETITIKERPAASVTDMKCCG
jgi:small GTP-binding protein